MTKDEELMQQALEALEQSGLDDTMRNYDKEGDVKKALRERLAQPRTCRWVQDDEDLEFWGSDCGEAWSFTEGGPEDNGFRYCHGCGKPVEIDRAPEDKP